MATKKKQRGPKMVSRSRSEAYAAFSRHDGASDATVASELGISRQRVSILRQEWRKAVGNGKEADTAETIAPGPFPAQPASAADLAMSGKAIGGDVLAMGASLVAFTVAWPDWADSAEEIAARHVGVLDADRVEALVMYRMNANSLPGTWKAVGVDPGQGRRMYQSDLGLRRLLDWANGLVELRVASSLLRIATGVGPQAVAAATIIAERTLGWNREATLHIEGEIEHKLDMTALLGSQENRNRISELEGLIQQGDSPALPSHEDAIEGEFVESPAP